MHRKQEWFNITSVHRLDLISLGFDGDAVDDATMDAKFDKLAFGNPVNIEQLLTN
jgi:hypothetical protein